MDDRRRNLIEKGQTEEINNFTFIPTINKPAEKRFSGDKYTDNSIDKFIEQRGATPGLPDESLNYQLSVYDTQR